MQPGDRVSLPRTCGTLPPIGPLASKVWPQVAFRGRAHNAGAEAVRPSPILADVLKLPATTWRAAVRDRLHAGRPGPDAPGFAGELDQRVRRKFGSAFAKNI